LAEIRVLDSVLDQELGSQIYNAYQNIDAENLYVVQYDTSLAVVGSAEDFGAATEAEIDAETYYLKLYTRRDPTVANNEDIVFAYGRVQKS
jgi:hypothetical protein